MHYWRAQLEQERHYAFYALHWLGGEVWVNFREAGVKEVTSEEVSL